MNNTQLGGCFPVGTQCIAFLQRCFTALALFFAFPLLLHAQDQVTLRFTGQDQNGDYVQLNTVFVENITKRWQEVLYYPDTVLNIWGVGIADPSLDGRGVRLFQNVPNPFAGVTDFALQLSEASNVQLEIYDLNGRMEASYKGTLDQGTHQFRAWLATPQTYLLNARTEQGVVRIMMVNAGHTGQSRIEYTGKGSSLQVDNPQNGFKGNITMPFNYGDTMSYIGNARIADRDFTSVPVVKAQYTSDLIPLVFTLPMPTVTTEAATAISSTQGQLNGYVVEHPDYPVTERGFLFADNTQFNGAVEYSTGAGSGQFHYTVSNLQLATRYYYQAYAQSAMGITYGDVLYFDTQAEMPTVLTLDVMDVKASKATVTGNVTATGGETSLVRGVCWSTSQSPTVNDNHTADSSGAGIFTSHITGLTPDTTYYVRAYATNSVGTAYGEQRSFTTRSAFYCGTDTLTDYDGNVYHTVEIGQQCWMRENLRTTHYSDGTEILPGGATFSATVAYRYAPNDNSSNVPFYGYLYNWAAVMHGAAGSYANPSGVQGVCPEGWHVPSDAEWIQMISYVCSQSQYWCGGDSNFVSQALVSPQGYIYQTGLLQYPPCSVHGGNPNDYNATGLSLLFSGHAPSSYFGIYAFYHTTNPTTDFLMSKEDFYTGGVSSTHSVPISVRCLLDDSGLGGNLVVVRAVTTHAVGDITSCSARCGGFVSGSGGADVTSRGVCWSMVPNPTVNDSHTTDGMGNGGFKSVLSGLMPGNTYYIRAYATNGVGTAYGEELSFTATHPVVDSVLIDAQTCPGADTMMDVDGNVYKTVQIGQQCWMRENLRTTHYADGTLIPIGTTTSTSVAYRYSPYGMESLVPVYGCLYNWPAVMYGAASSDSIPSGVQGICPNGWHMPSVGEWEQLHQYLRSQSRYWCGGDSLSISKALASSDIFWDNNNNYWQNPCCVTNNPITNNASGFSAYPAAGSFDGYSPVTSHQYVCYWAATLESNSHAYYERVDNQRSDAFIHYKGKHLGYSVRCLRD